MEHNDLVIWLIVFMIALSIILLVDQYARNSDCNRHCLYHSLLVNYGLREFIAWRGRGVPYVLYELLPVCSLGFIKSALIVVVGYMMLLYYYYSGRDILSVIVFMFAWEPLWLLLPWFNFMLYSMNKGLQPMRTWLWLRPWAIAILLILVLFTLEEVGIANKVVRNIILIFAYHFHPPTTFPVLVYYVLQGELLVIPVIVNIILYYMIGSVLWFNISLGVVGILLIVWDKRISRVIRQVIDKYWRPIVILLILLSFTPIGKPFPFGSSVALASPIILYCLFKGDVSFKVKLFTVYAVAMGFTPKGFSLPVGRYLPLVYMVAIREVDVFWKTVFILLSIPSIMLYLTAYYI